MSRARWYWRAASVIVPAGLGEDAELVVAAGHAGLVAEPLVDVEGALVLAGGLVVVPAVLGEGAELVVAGGHAGLVAEPLVDVEGALVLAGGLVIVPAGLGEDAELVVAGGHAGLVAEPLVDVEGALVLAGGLLIVPAGLGEHAEVVNMCGPARRAGGQPGERVVDQRGFLIPGTPGVQLQADSLGDLAGLFGVPGLQQVVTGLEQVMHVRRLVLRPHPDPPLPVGGGLPVGPGQPLAGLAGGPPGQFGGGPPVHEKPRLLVRRR